MVWVCLGRANKENERNNITCTLLQFQYNVYDSMVDNTIRIMSIHYNIDKKNIILIDNTIRVCCIETLGKGIKSS